jgi:O-antigen ligase
LMGILSAGLLIGFSSKLPFPVQRAFSFLPIQIDAAARQDAEGSMEWRVEMWRTVVPDVPKYLLKGKGYAIDPQELNLDFESISRGFAEGSKAAATSGKFHNGPLSILIPFGIYGLIGFLWLIFAGLSVLYRNYKTGDSRLQNVNTFLLGYYIVKAVFFVFLFGAIESDLYVFVGILGMSLAINGSRTVQNQESIPLIDNELATDFQHR